MNEDMIRAKIHQAVNVHGASMQDDPFLAQRIIAQTNRKEAPRMKKLSTGMIIAIVLMLLSVTAVAVGLTVEEIWRQSFEKMNTTGEIHNLSDETQAEISADEAISIARAAIIAMYGTPEDELDAMGVYPTYAARGWDGKTDDYPSDWRIYFSSRTGVDLDIATTEYGPTGEYRVYINAETKEVTFCHWYTNDFWTHAQRVWDCGSYDEVYWQYQQTEFYTQPIEMQNYWMNLLAEKGYEDITEDGYLHKVLLSSYLDLEFCELTRIADNNDPQVAAAWQALEKHKGLDAETLQKYAYVATIPDWETDTDNVCIHYSYELQWDWLGKGLIESHCNQLFTKADRLGLFMVSFEPGTTLVSAVTHVAPSEFGHAVSYKAEGLLAKVDWEPADLMTFDEAYTEMVKAYARMEAAGATLMDKSLVLDAVMLALGGDPQYYTNEASYDVRPWFTEEGPHVSPFKPTLDHDDVVAQYGESSLFWPLEIQYDQLHQHSLHYSLPREGEMTLAVATELALDAIREKHGQKALDDLGEYSVGCSFVRRTGEYGKEITQWFFYITDNPEQLLNGWQVSFIGENYEDYGSRCITVELISEAGFG